MTLNILKACALLPGCFGFTQFGFGNEPFTVYNVLLTAQCKQHSTKTACKLQAMRFHAVCQQILFLLSVLCLNDYNELIKAQMDSVTQNQPVQSCWELHCLFLCIKGFPLLIK